MEEVSLEYVRTPPGIHARKVSVAGEPTVPVATVTISEGALDRLSSLDQDWNRNETKLKAFVAAFVFDDGGKNRRQLDMVLRDSPELNACIWATPGEETAHILLWEECQERQHRGEG